VGETYGLIPSMLERCESSLYCGSRYGDKLKRFQIVGLHERTGQYTTRCIFFSHDLLTCCTFHSHAE